MGHRQNSESLIRYKNANDKKTHVNSEWIKNSLDKRQNYIKGFSVINGILLLVYFIRKFSFEIEKLGK